MEFEYFEKQIIKLALEKEIIEYKMSIKRTSDDEIAELYQHNIDVRVDIIQRIKDNI